MEAGVFLAWNVLSQGWFSFFTVDVPLQHVRGGPLFFWKTFLARMAPVTLLGPA